MEFYFYPTDESNFKLRAVGLRYPHKKSKFIIKSNILTIKNEKSPERVTYNSGG